MMPTTLNRPIFAKDVVRFVGDIVAAIVAESKAAGGRRGRHGRRRLRAAAAGHHGRRRASMPDAAILFPEHGSNVCFGTDLRSDDVDPLEGADDDRRGDDGQPAAGRRADGDQRHPRRARRDARA